nr:hypothetical protein [Tanacetum cinerariifolium]
MERKDLDTSDSEVFLRQVGLEDSSRSAMVNELSFKDGLLEATFDMAHATSVRYVETPIVDDNPSVKTSPNVPNVDDNLVGKVSPSDLIVQYVDINTTSKSYAGAAGASTKDQPKVISNFRPLVADLVYDGVNILYPVKSLKRNNWGKHGLKRIMMNIKGFFFFKFNSRASLEAVLEVGPWMIRKSLIILKKWSMGMILQKKPSMLTMNGGRPADIYKIFGHVQDQYPKKVNVRYEPKAATNVPKKGATNMGNAFNSSSVLKYTGNSSNNDNIISSNSFVALDVKEE